MRPLCGKNFITLPIMRKIALFLGVWTALLWAAMPMTVAAQNTSHSSRDTTVKTQDGLCANLNMPNATQDGLGANLGMPSAIQDGLGANLNMPTTIQDRPSNKADGLGKVQNSARTIKDFFVAMPDSLMPMLEQSARKDLVDIAESGMTSALDNEWGGKSRLQTLTSNYLMLVEDVADSITVEMTLLPRAKDTLLCLIRTIPLPQKDSELMLFNSHWQQVKPRGDIAEVCLSPTHALHLRLLAKQKAGVSVVATAKKIGTLSDPLNGPSDKSQPDVVYTWNGTKFVRQK